MKDNDDEAQANTTPADDSGVTENNAMGEENPDKLNEHKSLGKTKSAEKLSKSTNTESDNSESEGHSFLPAVVMNLLPSGYSDSLNRILDRSFGYLIVQPRHPKEELNNEELHHEIAPKRSKSLTRSPSLTGLKILKSKSLTKLQPRRSKSLSQGQPKKSKSLTRMQTRKSKSLTKVTSLTGLKPEGLTIYTDPLFHEPTSLSRRGSWTRVRRKKKNWLYKNCFFLTGFFVVFSILLWGLYSIIQDGIERERQNKPNLDENPSTNTSRL